MQSSVFDLRSHRRLLVCLSAGLCACASAEPSARLPSPDGDRFAREVYPVLLRDCGMSNCHGSPQRFFFVAGPGRTRLSSDTDLLAPATAAEILVSYDRTISMLQGAAGARASLLLRKPLDLAAGGAAHEGDDVYGRNVYADTEAQGYRTIASWALGMMNHAGEAP
jgi:hypothetical protein